MEINWNIVALVAGLFFYGMLAAALLRKPLKAVWEQLKALPRMAQALLAVMAVVATVEAQKPGNGGGTNEPPANAPSPGGGMAGALPSLSQPSMLRIAERPGAARPSNLRLMGAGEPEETVTVEEIAQGYRLDYETTETGHSFAMPSNAVYIGRLHQHGARSDFGKHIVDLDAVGGEATGWTFSYGPSNAATSGLIPSTFNGVGESCNVYVSKKSTGWGVSVGDEWLGMTLQYWPEVLTSVDSIAAARGIVSEFADERVAACVESLDDYAQLAAWAGEKDIYQPALKDSPHAWSSFALGTAALLENEPGIEIGDVSVVTDAGSVPSMTISVVVRDGDSMVLADSAKVAEMFEAAGDLADWTGSALAPDVRCVGVYDGVMRFAVGLGDVSDGRAFLRIRKEP